MSPNVTGNDMHIQNLDQLMINTGKPMDISERH